MPLGQYYSNRWPDSGLLSGIGSCACSGGGPNGPVYSILCYLGGSDKLANNHPAPFRFSAPTRVIVIAGAFTKWQYQKWNLNVANPVWENRTVDAGHIAKFYLDGAGNLQMTWPDEKWARHASFENEVVAVRRNRKRFAEDSEIFAFNSQEKLRFKVPALPGYPAEDIESWVHKLELGTNPVWASSDPPLGRSFRFPNYGVISDDDVLTGAGLLVNSIDAGYPESHELMVMNFEGAQTYDRLGARLTQRFSTANLHVNRWREDETWMLGTRRIATYPTILGPGEVESPPPTELKLLNLDASVNEPWQANSGGEASCNTSILTTGTHQGGWVGQAYGDYTYSNRSLDYDSLSYKWNGAGEAKYRGILKLNRDGSPVAHFNVDIDAGINGCTLFDIDNKQRLYFGGEVFSVNGTPCRPWGLYRVEFDGTGFFEFGQFRGAQGSLGRVYDAKVFAGSQNAPPEQLWQIIVGGDFQQYTPPVSALVQGPVAAKNLAVLSIETQQAPQQLHWPIPYNQGGAIKPGDFLHGLLW